MSKVQQHINTTRVQKTSYNKHMRMLKKKKRHTEKSTHTQMKRAYERNVL